MRYQPRKPTGSITLNKGAVRARGLVGYWPSEPRGGRIYWDLSTNLSLGTLPDFTWTPGLDGGMVPRFNGANGNACTINSAANWPLGTTSRTVSCWFKMEANQDSQLISYGGNGADGTRFGIFYSVSLGGLGGEFINSLGYFPWTYNANWNHIAIVLTGTTANSLLIYYNGAHQSETFINGTNTLNTLSTAPVFGALSGLTSGSRFIGLLDEICIHKRALPASEIAAMYNGPTRWQLRWQPSRTARLFKQGNPIVTNSPFRNIIIDQAVKTASYY